MCNIAQFLPLFLLSIDVNPWCSSQALVFLSVPVAAGPGLPAVQAVLLHVAFWRVSSGHHQRQLRLPVRLACQVHSPAASLHTLVVITVNCTSCRPSCVCTRYCYSNQLQATSCPCSWCVLITATRTSCRGSFISACYCYSNQLQAFIL